MQTDQITVLLCSHYRKRAASLSCYDAQKLDIGVTGMEFLSGSRVLLSLPEKDDVGCC